MELGDDNNFEYAEKDQRHTRIKRGDKFKKRDNVKESEVREEKTQIRHEQSQATKSRNSKKQSDDSNDSYDEEDGGKKVKKSKKGISSRLTKEEKQALYLQDQLNQKPPKKGKQKHLERSREG